MASKVYKSSTHILILITLPVRLLQQRAGKTSQTSQRIIMRKIGFALALIVFTIFIQVRPRICNHINFLLVYQNKPPIFNLQILIFFSHEIGFSFWSAQNGFLFENQNSQKMLTFLSKKTIFFHEKNTITNSQFRIGRFRIGGLIWWADYKFYFMTTRATTPRSRSKE